MSFSSASLQEHSPTVPANDFATPGLHAGLGTVRLVHPGAEQEGDRRPPRARLRRLLGLQMDAFVAEAVAGEHPRLLAGRIDNIVQLIHALYSHSRASAARRRESARLPAILQHLESQRAALLAREQAPAGIRHALDPLLVAVLRGDLDAG